MAQPTNSFDSYDSVGIREDLSDIIYNVDPFDTPMLTSASKISASQAFHEWQTDALRASAANANIEGDDTVAESRTATTRLGNYMQIFKNAVVIPDSDDGTDKAGRGGEMAEQVMKVAKEQKLDIERALFLNTARNVGSATVARLLGGVPTWLTTNTTFESGSSGADPTGDGTDVRVDDGSPTALTQARFDTTMQSIWDNSGSRSNHFNVLLNSFQMNVALGFTGNNNQRSTIASDKNQVVNVIDVYMTPWGIVDFVMSREHRARDVFIMDMDMWKIAEKRPMKNVELGKTGDNTKRQVTTELSLVASNEKSSGAVYDNTTS